MSWKDYTGLVTGMVRTGILGYGGGPSVIPLIRYEAVTRYQWVTDEEFGEILAIANALPGPIATKMAAYLGYKTKGVLGAIVSVLAHILPTSIAIIALLGSMYALRESKIVAGMVAAVRPVIFVMLGMMAYEFAKSMVRTRQNLCRPVWCHCVCVIAAAEYSSRHCYRRLPGLWRIPPGSGSALQVQTQLRQGVS